ncbi:MAG: hypothetical protein AAF800_08200 [Planctomycetota bacterium]
MADTDTLNEAAAPTSKPSRGWYGLAFVLMLVGVAAFTASLQVAQARVDDAMGAMQRFVAPGSASLTFDRPGTYLVYYEKIGRFEGEDFDTTRVFAETPALDVDVRHAQSGEYLDVDLAKYDRGESQMFNHGRANSEFVFDVTEPGDYTITAAHETPDLDVPVLLAVGPPVVGSLMSDWRGPFGGAAVLAFAAVVSATTVLVTYALRHDWLTKRSD